MPTRPPPSTVAPIVEQDGVLTYGQAKVWFTPGQIRADLGAGRWQRPARGVVVVHNGPLTSRQRDWVALLSGPPGTALGGLTALRWDGFEGFEDLTADRPQIVLPKGAHRPPVALATPHWSTLLSPDDVSPLSRPRRTRRARSLLDEASWSQAPRRARAVILAGAQQRLVRTGELGAALARRGPCRHRHVIVEPILDAAGGIQSLPERDFDLICRARRLPPVSRQRAIRRRDGKYFLDASWDEFDTSCEIHGIPHLAVLQWTADLLRANEIAIRGPRQLVFSSYAVRHQPAQVADQIVGLLRRGGWRG